MDRIILHSDINCCYASIEHLYHPELAGKPLAVAGSKEERHGIILAADYECKKYGVKTTMPIWQAKRLCPQMTVLEPRMELYQQYAGQVRELYYEYTDRVEPFGMDESWLDLTQRCKDMEEGYRMALEINRRVREEIGITVSIGVSWNKVFAKLGSDYKKPDGVTLFGRQQYDRIKALPADSLLYVGRSTKKRLEDMGIRTIGHLAETPAYVLERNLGKAGTTLGIYARGEDCEPVRVAGTRERAKSIGNSTTTAHDFCSNREVKEVISRLSEQVGERMRRQGLKGQLVELWLRDARLCCLTRQKKLPEPTSLDSDIARAAYELFCENYRFGEPLRSVGVRCGDLSDEDEPVQMTLFEDYAALEKRQRMNAAVDEIRKKFGKDSVKLGISYHKE